MISEIEAMPLKQLERLQKDFPQDFAEGEIWAIKIHNSDVRPIDKNVNVLDLFFDDESPLEDYRVPENLVCMDLWSCNRLSWFFHKLGQTENVPDRLIVSCPGGVSRSVGLASGIAKAVQAAQNNGFSTPEWSRVFAGAPEVWCLAPNVYPNRWVENMTLYTLVYGNEIIKCDKSPDDSLSTMI